jgi:hypothetical protein
VSPGLDREAPNVVERWLDDMLAHPVSEPFDTAEAVREARRERGEAIARNVGSPR